MKETEQEGGSKSQEGKATVQLGAQFRFTGWTSILETFLLIHKLLSKPAWLALGYLLYHNPIRMSVWLGLRGRRYPGLIVNTVLIVGSGYCNTKKNSLHLLFGV